MDIKLYNMNQEYNRVNKRLTSETSYSGNLRDESDLVHPIIHLYSTSVLTNYYNYAYISEFKRYYFINKIKVLRTNLYELELFVDVLMSYSSQIKNLTCIIKRQEQSYNLYLDDPEFKSYSYTRIQTKTFPYGFTENPNFILTVAGGS